MNKILIKFIHERKNKQGLCIAYLQHIFIVIYNNIRLILKMLMNGMNKWNVLRFKIY